MHARRLRYEQDCEELGVFQHYAVRTVLADGKLFLCHRRPRVYILFVHKRVGGAAALARASQAMMVADVVLGFWQLSVYVLCLEPMHAQQA